MKNGVNKVILLGNVGSEPETKFLNDGKLVANLTVATNITWKDKNSREEKKKVEWHRVVGFHPVSGILSQYVHKGDAIYIEGRLQTRKWQDNNGVDKYTTEIIAEQIRLMGATHKPNQQQNQQPPQSHSDYNQSKSFDDDVNF